MIHPVSAGLCAVAGLASGGLVPLLIVRLPPVEVAVPAPDRSSPDRSAPDRSTPDQPDRTELVDVAAVARRPRLRVQAVAACGVAAAVLGASLGPSWSLLYLLALVPIGVALATVDWHTRILPSRLIRPTYPLLVVGIVASWLLDGRPEGSSPLIRAGVGALVLLGCFYGLWVISPSGIGFGDVRLSGLLGLALGYLGWDRLVVGIYAGFLLGGAIGGVLTVARVMERRGFPFGPFLLVGALVGVVVGRPVMAVFTS